MKLSNLFMIALLAGTLGVFGCSDDPPSNGNGGTGGDGAAGTGGTGGGAADPCTGGLCETADVKIDCEAAITTCIADAELDLTDEQCEAASTELYCNIGTGTGGTGGTGGDGGGGAGGASGVAGCNVELCLTNADRKAACEEFMPWCIEFCEGEGSMEACGEDECIGFAAVFICREQ